MRTLKKVATVVVVLQLTLGIDKTERIMKFEFNGSEDLSELDEKIISAKAHRRYTSIVNAGGRIEIDYIGAAETPKTSVGDILNNIKI